MARVIKLVCDSCDNEIDSGGATLRLNFTDARRGAKQADLCDSCAGEMPGKAVARRGRKPAAISEDLAPKRSSRREPVAA